MSSSTKATGPAATSATSDGLQGRVAVVTGATAGIGRATALALSAAGAAVVAAGRRTELGEEVVDEIRKNGGTAAFVQTDVRLTSDVERLARSVVDEFGAIDVLVNNAGVIAWGPTHATDDATLEELVAVNLAGTFRTTRAVLPHMLQRGSGSIINLSTATALRGFPGTAAYSAVKAGILALTRTWATEYGPHGIRVNAIAPGPIATAMTQQLLADPAAADQMRNLIPARRIGQPEDVASAVVYLAGPDAQFLHGVTLPVDGGVLAS